MKEENSLLLKPITENDWPIIYSAGGLDDFYAYVVGQVNEVPDVTTAKGVARVKSLAAMVSASKKAVELPGREYLKFLKEKPKLVEPVLKDWVDRMDKLRDQVREPVTRLEEQEKSRIQALQERLSVIRKYADMEINPTNQSATLAVWLDDLGQIIVDESFQEFQPEALQLKEKAVSRLTAAHDTRLQFEQQQIEIQRLAKEKAALEQAAREKEIAENARIAAEEKARRDLAELEERAKHAEQQAIRRAEESARREKEAAELAEQRQKQAIENERARLAKIESDRIAADRARAEDVERQRKVHNEILEAIKQYCVNEQVAKALVSAMARNEIPNVKVEY
jgi:hypothetical protein